MSEPPDRATHWESLYRAWARLPVPVNMAAKMVAADPLLAAAIDHLSQSE